MNRHHKSRKIIVTGESGSGKSTLYFDLIVRDRARWKFIFDPDLEFSVETGIRSCRTVPEMNKAILEKRPVVFNSSLHFPGEREVGFAFFCRYVWLICAVLKGTKLFATDEVQGVTMPGLYGLPQAFKLLYDEGRKREIDIMLICQRPSDVNYVVRGQATEIYTFQHYQMAQLETLYKEWGFEPEQVKALTYPGGWIHFSKRTRTFTRHDPVSNPKRKRDCPKAVRQ